MATKAVEQRGEHEERDDARAAPRVLDSTPLQRQQESNGGRKEDGGVGRVKAHDLPRQAGSVSFLTSLKMNRITAMASPPIGRLVRMLAMERQGHKAAGGQRERGEEKGGEGEGDASLPGLRGRWSST